MTFQVPPARLHVIGGAQSGPVDAVRLVLGDAAKATERDEFRVRYEIMVNEDAVHAQLLLPLLRWPDVLVDPFGSGAERAVVKDGAVCFEYPALIAGEVIHLEVGFALGVDRPSGICTSLPWDLPVPRLLKDGREYSAHVAANVRWGAETTADGRVTFRETMRRGGKMMGGRPPGPCCTVFVGSEFDPPDAGAGGHRYCRFSRHALANRDFIEERVSEAASFLGRLFPDASIDHVLVLTEAERGRHHSLEAPGLIILPPGHEGASPADYPEFAFSLVRQLFRTWIGGVTRPMPGKRSVDYESLLGALAIASLEPLGYDWPRGTLGVREFAYSRVVEAIQRPRRLLTKLGRAQHEALRLAERVRAGGMTAFADQLRVHHGKEIVIETDG